MEARGILEREVRRVRRRMQRGAIIAALPFGWTAGLLLLASVCLLRSFLPTTLPLAGLIVACFALGTALAVGIGVRRAPNERAAALVIDQVYGLKERVASALTMSPEAAASDAGQALLADASSRLSQADLARRFGPRPSWREYVWPALAAGLAVGAFYLGPALAGWAGGEEPPGETPIDPAQVALELEDLRKASAFQNDDKLPRSKEMEALALEWDGLINKPLDPANQEHVRERTREIQDFKDKLREAADRLTAKNNDARDALAKLLDAKAGPQDGPAKELAEALAKGDFARAREVIDRLHKNRKDKKLDKEEERKLAEDLKDLEDRLRRLADQEERRNALAREHKEGKLNDGELARELERLAELAENLKDVGELAQMLPEWNKQMDLDPDRAGEKLDRMRAALQRMEMGKSDLKMLREEMRRLDEAQAALCRLCEGQGKMAGAGAGKSPGGKRPIADKDPEGKVVSSPDRARLDAKGKLHVSGHGWGGATFSKIPAREVGGAVDVAAQEAPDVIERQRIPAEAADLARGYFQKLGGQKCPPP